MVVIGFSLLGVCGDVVTVERSRRYVAALRCFARLSKIGITSAIIWAKNSFSQSARFRTHS